MIHNYIQLELGGDLHSLGGVKWHHFNCLAIMSRNWCHFKWLRVNEYGGDSLLLLYNILPWWFFSCSLCWWRSNCFGWAVCLIFHSVLFLHTDCDQVLRRVRSFAALHITMDTDCHLVGLRIDCAIQVYLLIQVGEIIGLLAMIWICGAKP